MICFEVYINNKKLCKAGINENNGILSGIINLLKITNENNNQEENMDISIGGLASDTGEQLEWLHQKLEVGDEIKIKIISDSICDEPQERKRESSPEIIIKNKIKYFTKLKQELKDFFNDKVKLDTN